MKKPQRAFTLLELLVAMAIMAILTVIGLVSFGTVREKARDSKRKEHIQSVSKAFELYYNDTGHYPLSSNGSIVACGTDAGQACVWGDAWMNTSNNTLYMAELPTDPGGQAYYYETDAEGSYYRLFAFLENDDDPQVAQVEGQPGFYLGTACEVRNGTLTTNSCNYILMSGNIIATPLIVSEPG